MSDIAKHSIDGEWTGSGTVSESVNPATGAVPGRWAEGGAAEARGPQAFLDSLGTMFTRWENRRST